MSNPTILVVEDEAHLADGLRYNLEAEGYEAIILGCYGDPGIDALRELVQTQSAELKALKAEVAALKGSEPGKAA